ncbi:MAG: hypothetical protein PHU69_14850 [Fermentimonas sp.]|nr:hypothetical protein [Fermentimonas sp.]
MLTNIRGENRFVVTRVTTEVTTNGYYKFTFYGLLTIIDWFKIKIQL